MSLFSRVYQRLLPQGRAFFFWQSTSQLRQFFEGLAGLPTDAQAFLDLVWEAVGPATTDELPAWETQFGLPESGMSEADRRTRLDATWAALGGQSLRYLQDTLQASGFNVFVHDWWLLPRGPTAIPIDPRSFLADGDGPQLAVLCGELEALCGEDGSATSFPILAPVSCGQSTDPVGYVLVNKIPTTTTQFLGCGDAELECSDKEPLEDPIENFAFCGQPLSITLGSVQYPIPDDPDRWRYFLYYGGETLPARASVDGLRRKEFEDLVLKLSPGQLWLGILVDYT